MIDENTLLYIEKLTPIIAVIVVGATSWLPSVLTNRANREIAAYNKKKDDLFLFTDACGKYFGTISILTSALEAGQSKNDDSRYTDSVVQQLSECKWRVLAFLDDDSSKEIYDQMLKLEDLAEELRCARISQNLFMLDNKHDDLLHELIRKIEDEIKPAIFDTRSKLQEMLMAQRQILSGALDKN